MVENTIDETPISSPRLIKARRLLAEDRVTEVADGTWRVRGDHGDHKLAFGETDIHCSCKAGSFGNGCSHRDAVELALSRKRRAA